MLYLLPVVNFAAQTDYEKAKKHFSELLDVLASSKNYSISVKVGCLLHMFNSTSKGLKAMVFKTLVKLCQQEGSLDIIVQKARSVEKDSADWNLSLDEKKDLLLSIAKSLDAEEDDGAFSVLHAYLRQFENKDNLTPSESEARRCVILAIKSRSVINFEELLDLKAIKSLKDVSFFCNLKPLIETSVLFPESFHTN
jgi:hypothetical protein